MKKNIYISYQRDSDLVALYKEVGSKMFMNLVKESLRVLVRKNYTPIHKLPPEFMISKFAHENEEKNNDYIRLQVCLTSYKDDDIIHLLEHISEKKAGMFIKNALRFYIGPVLCLQGFLDDEFKENLYNNCKLMQVFSLGNFESEKPERIKRERKQRRTSTQRRKKEETNISNSTAPFPEIKGTVENNTTQWNTSPIDKIAEVKNEKSIYMSSPNPISTDIIQDNQNNENISEEDEMLSLLEGLLG